MIGYWSLVGMFLVSLVVTSSGRSMEPSDNTGTTWAFLVAGSKGWTNYRHQSDVAHAYQIMLKNGIPAKNIIVMMFDDVAKHPSNPTPGKLFNKPDGPDVYQGVVVDYKGADVTPKNFKNVLLGNKAEMKGVGTGRVLESGLDDTVFVNFVDHGSTGLIAFPSEVMYAKDLNETLGKMRTKNLYGKHYFLPSNHDDVPQLIFYLEACESGSMFDNILSQDRAILASTASGTDESSWAYYCDTGTCLGDFYSIAWMERLDEVGTETAFENFDVVRTRTTKSHVNLYGDYHLGFETVVRSLSSDEEEVSTVFNPQVTADIVSEAVDVREIPVHMTRQQIKNAKTPEERKELEEKLEKILEDRDLADNLVRSIARQSMHGDEQQAKDVVQQRYRLTPSVFPCYQTLVDTFNDQCFSVTKNTYFLKHLYIFANMCLKNVPAEEVTSVMNKICASIDNKDTFDIQ